MTFLSPLLLAGLAALAVPVLVHLYHRERSQVIAFPSLMFLEKVPYRTVRRQRIRFWGLFLLRSAAIALLVLAFARPFFPEAAVAQGGTPAREVVILLDRSFSMGYDGVWARAQAAVRSVVDGLADDDRVSLVLFDEAAEVVVRSAPETSTVLAAAEAASPGSAATRYGPALKVAAGLVESSRLAAREVVLVSDLQRAGWDVAEVPVLPGEAVLTPMPVGEADPANLAVASVSLARSDFSDRERVDVTALVVNRGDAARSDVGVALEIEGRAIETRAVSLEPHGSATVTFASLTLGEGSMRGAVRLAADALATDDTFYFVIAPSAAVRVVLVHPRASAAATLYLRRALEVGTGPTFAVDLVTSVPADLAAGTVVVLDDAPLGAQDLGRLEAFVNDGGGVLAVLGERTVWPGGGSAILPGGLDPPADFESTRGGSLAVYDTDHPLFSVFRSPRSGDLTASRFFRYRPVVAAEEAFVLARFDNGAPAVVERRSGRGRMVALASTLDNTWNNLVVAPVYVPFLHETIKYLAGYTAPAAWRPVGQAIDPADRLAAGGDLVGFLAAAEEAGSEVLALSPSGERREMGAESVLRLDEPGFFDVRAPDAENQAPVVIAANADRIESDLSALDPEEVAAVVTGRAGGDGDGAGGSETVELTPEEQERRQGIWWWALLAVTALCAVDTVVSNRLRGRASAPVAGSPAGPDDVDAGNGPDRA